MSNFKSLILCAALGGLGFAAQAAMPVNAADLPRISNGSTGYIGLTASAGSERIAYKPMRSSTSSIPTQAGEASTMVDGVPNRNVDVVSGAGPMAGHRDRAELRTMGNSGTAPAAAHPGWGTPK